MNLADGTSLPLAVPSHPSTLTIHPLPRPQRKALEPVQKQIFFNPKFITVRPVENGF